MSLLSSIQPDQMRRVTIAQGDSVASRDLDLVYTTVLGSCVAVCLHDSAARVGGINHFLLADPAPINGESGQLLNRYGIHAMELLINEMIKRGAARDRLRARVYGGGSMRQGLGDIGTQNIAFARRFLANEGIPILGEDVGGTSARRVEFLPAYGRARCKSIQGMVAEQQPVPVSAPCGDVELF
jgi:chemotaxis protein CheD